jgi:hypothetical protein
MVAVWGETLTVSEHRESPAPDRFLVGPATLTLLAEAAERQQLICVVDDAQWLDQAPAQVLGFVARRLQVERIAVVCAARTGIGDEVLAGLPVMSIAGLDDTAAGRCPPDAPSNPARAARRPPAREGAAAGRGSRR